MEQNEPVLEDEDMDRHPPGGNELATQESLGAEPWLGEKPPWVYVREEESSQLLLVLAHGVLQLHEGAGGKEQVLQLCEGGGGGVQVLQLCERAGGEEQVLQLSEGGCGGVQVLQLCEE